MVDYCSTAHDALHGEFPCDGEWVSCYIWCDRYYDCSDSIDEKWCLKQRKPFAVMNSGNQSLIAELSWYWRIRYIMKSKDEQQISNLTAAQQVWWIMRTGQPAEKQALKMEYQQWYNDNPEIQRSGPDPSVTLPPLNSEVTTHSFATGLELVLKFLGWKKRPLSLSMFNFFCSFFLKVSF